MPKYFSVYLGFALCLFPVCVSAIVIDSVSTFTDPTVSSIQSVSGAGGDYVTTTTYNVNYGQSSNLRMAGFLAGGNAYSLNSRLPTGVYLRRNLSTPTAVIPGHHQVGWYRTTSTNTSDNLNLEASFVPSLEALLGGNIINRGTDNMFQQVGDNRGNMNNIERADFIFSGADALAPKNQAHLDGVGFTVLERGGNDSMHVVAILGIDNSNNVTKLSTPVSIATNGWGNGLWNTTRRTLVLRDTAVEGEFRPSANVVAQQAYGLFFSLGALGVDVGDTVYGYTIMSGDTNITNVDALLDWTDNAVFPTNTSTAGGLDLISGGSGFIDEELDTTGLFTPIPEPSLFSYLVALSALSAVMARRRR